MLNKIKQARLLAEFVHMGQKRQDGEDYINHCRRVADAVELLYSDRVLKEKELREYEDMICVAWLHDVLEDGLNPVAIQSLLCSYFSGRIYFLICVLTHKKWQTYDKYIERVSIYPEALQIKWLDMIDNTSYNIPEKQWKKYRDAIIHLIGLGNPIRVPEILATRLKLEQGDKL